MLKKAIDTWSVNEIITLYGIKSKTAFFKAEKAGRIPSALRDSRKVRSWALSDLPSIGAAYGFLSKPKNFEFTTICVFTAKGGVLKTTVSYALARIFALHGLKVLIVGNDPQTSITGVTLNPLIQNKSLEDLPAYQDLGAVIFDKVPIEEVVQKTNLPNLDLLPETSDLSDIGDSMGTLAALAANKGKVNQPRPRYKYFADILNKKIKEAGYDLAIYDNGPTLTILAENALYGSDYWITPNGCDQGSYQVFESNFNKVLQFAENVGKEWKKIFLVPTLKESTNLSLQIYGTYIGKYPGFVSQSSIRKTVKAQEALAMGLSPNEVFLDSELSQDFVALAKEIWSGIVKNNSRILESANGN
jgi:chromosome partitioning protein